jgi:hypothetical protein
MSRWRPGSGGRIQFCKNRRPRPSGCQGYEERGKLVARLMQRSRSQKEKWLRRYPLRLRGLRSSTCAVFRRAGLTLRRPTVAPRAQPASSSSAIPEAAGGAPPVATLLTRSHLSMANKLHNYKRGVNTTRTCTRTIPGRRLGGPLRLSGAQEVTVSGLGRSWCACRKSSASGWADILGG